MQPIASGSAATSRIETDERQLSDDLKPQHKSVAAYNKQISEIPELELVESLGQLKLDPPPDATLTTAIDERSIGLNISTMTQSDAGLDGALQQHDQRNTPYNNSSLTEPESADKATVPAGAVPANSVNALASLSRPSTDVSGTESPPDDSDTESSTDDSDTESASQKASTAVVSGATANSDTPVPVNESQGAALINSQSGEMETKKADIFQCQTNYLELKQVISFGHYVCAATFSPSTKHLVIDGEDSEDDRILGIWQQTADGNWSQNGKFREHNFRFEFNRSENTLLRTSSDGKVTVSKLNSNGFWEGAVVLEHSPCLRGEDNVRVIAGFSPRQDKIMTYDYWAGKIKVLPVDSNGQWTPLTQTQEISHRRHWGPQQQPFKATDHNLLTYRGSTATIWAFNDDSNCMEVQKIIEFSKWIWSAQMSDDEQYAVLFGVDQAIFLGCDGDGEWSQIGEVCHPESYSKAINKHIKGYIHKASFNASRQYALSIDSNHIAIISGYDENGSWEVKTEIQDCSDVRFSASGRKLLAQLHKPLSCNKTDDPLDQGQTPDEHSNNCYESFIRRTYKSFKLWDCSSNGGRLDKVQTCEHSGSKTVIFSPSENFLLSYGVESNFACIWGYDEEGNLVEKAKAFHRGGIHYAAFNAQGDSVLTRGNDQVVKIHGLDSQGEWQEQLVVKHQRDIRDGFFSDSGHLAYTVGLGGTACILGRDNNDQWMKQAMTNLADGYSIEGAQFNGLDNHFLIYGKKIDKKDKHQPGLVQLWGLDSDDKWVEKEQIKLDYPVKKAEFSPDNDHLLISCNDDRRGYFRSKNGTVLLWKIPSSPGEETAHT
ncbi:WD40 repeat domain-containing protein [Salinisphaera sp. G21_0]|uniref:WD40 repeat domain-containing protein n=2 Tax=Salinisphaera sp. G21_0 TaxID=2821094 RepID=UPI001ADA3A5A|nr:WD40 repeat domain-containing protein [Salinisphaera sp. G21_0]MBO9482217.1 WD40 repeat domain-containing protein [Salinisphaera sp. G21_0]